MDRDFQRAIAAEIRAEIARKDLRRTAVGKEAGIDAKAWTNYFVEPIKRDVHLGTVAAICKVLGVPLSEMIARAEKLEREGALAQLTPAQRDELSERLAADLNDPEVDAARAAFFAEQERKKRSR